MTYKDAALPPSLPLPDAPWKKHLKFFHSFIASICTTTPLLAFPTLEPLLINAKAFATFCPKYLLLLLLISRSNRVLIIFSLLSGQVDATSKKCNSPLYTPQLME